LKEVMTVEGREWKRIILADNNLEIYRRDDGVIICSSSRPLIIETRHGSSIRVKVKGCRPKKEAL